MAKSHKGRSDGIVYSTQNLGAESTWSGLKKSSGDAVVRVGRETKGRKGAGVTVVIGAPLAGKDLADLAKRLKKSCGAGGTLKNDVIEIQGDKRDQVIALLEKRGWTVKRVGG